MKIKDILKAKGGIYESIDPLSTVQMAMEKMSRQKIGSLLVVKNNRLLGIITERDIFKLVASHCEKAFSEAVEKHMSKNLVIGLPDDDINVAMAYMTNNRFRHLPIVDGEKIAGVISIGDLIKAEVQDLKVENRYLINYITGKYPQ